MSNGRSLEQFSRTFDASPYARCDSTLLKLRSCYRDMPGTILTLAQACRLTGASESRVKAALNAADGGRLSAPDRARTLRAG
jgi:hypothetical protein